MEMKTRKNLYPTWAQLESVVQWATYGSQSLKGEKRDDWNRDVVRTTHLRHIKQVAERLGLDAQYRLWLSESSHRRSGELDTRTRDEMITVARYYGYVTAGAEAVVPLKGHELHAINLLIEGYTHDEVAVVMGTHRSNIYQAVSRVKERHGCATTVQAVALVVDNGWIPGQAEIAKLLSRRGIPMAPGFIANTRHEK